VTNETGQQNRYNFDGERDTPRVIRERTMTQLYVMEANHVSLFKIVKELKKCEKKPQKRQ
jgi:hypothetical protein